MTLKQQITLNCEKKAIELLHFVKPIKIDFFSSETILFETSFCFRRDHLEVARAKKKNRRHKSSFVQKIQNLT